MMQRNTFLKMSEAAVKDFLESNLDFYGDYSVNTRRINPEELEDIVLSFLQDYDENFYLKYNDKLRKGEIFSAMISDAGGMTCPFGTINNNFIFIQDYYRDTLQFGSILVHELAHSFEFDLNYSVGNKNVNERLFTTPFYEVSSSFFEYAFLRYLKENKIHEDIADSLLNEYYIEAFIKILEMNILCRHQNFIYDELGRVILNDMEVMRDVEDVKEKLNYYELPELGDTLSLTNSFVYGVGGLFSIYLYDNYKKEPEAFKKEFSNALLSYGIIKDISAFEKVGITPDELEKSGSLRRILTREY